MHLRCLVHSRSPPAKGFRLHNDDVIYWHMNGASFVSNETIYQGIDTRFRIVGTADFSQEVFRGTETKETRR